jgi:hypothetical protein
MNLLQKLRSVVTDIQSPKGPVQLKDSWELAERLLTRFPTVDAKEATRICKERDIPGLDAIVKRLESPAPRPAEAAPSGAPIPKETLDKAFRAFRKRLETARLSDESRLSGRLTTAGRKSQIDAIQPPIDFPPEVWRALAADGRLEHTGKGFYAIPGDTHENAPPPLF